MAKNKKQSFSIQKDSKRPMLLWGLALIIICMLAFLAYIAYNNGQKSNELSGTATDPYVNLDPPTEADKLEADQNKERLSQTKELEESNIPSGSDPQKKSVKPTITEATRTSIKAYVAGIFEEGGTCTATFTKDGQTLTKTSAGFQNASYTQCAPMDLANDFLSSGKWAVKLSYGSATSAGESDVHYIE